MNSALSPTADLKNQLLADFTRWEREQSNAGNQNLLQLRRSAITHFDRLGFPTTKHEEWKYTNLAPLLKENISFDPNPAGKLTSEKLQSVLIPGLDANVLVFENGTFRKDLSTISSPDRQVQISPILEAAAEYSDAFASNFGRSVSHEQDALVALNTAFTQSGVFIRVPDGVAVEKPIVLYFLNQSGKTATGSNPRNLVVLGRNSEAKVVEVFAGESAATTFTNSLTEIFLEEDARFDYYKIHREGDTAYHIGTTQVVQKNRSHLYAANLAVDGGFIRNNLQTVLDGEYCEAYMYGLYLPDHKQLMDSHTTVDHAKPNSYSNELYKGVLNGKGTGVFNGKIFVRPDAQKTNAFQSNRNIVLSREASMNTKPQLEIFADDVKCSHGSTTGQLDDEALFYLRSRGIGAENAKSLLTIAFAQDVVNQLKDQAIRTYAEKLVSEKLSKIE